MMNRLNSTSTNACHFVLEYYRKYNLGKKGEGESLGYRAKERARGIKKTLTTSIWIIDERNSTSLNIDVQQPVVRTMWYRFLLIIIIFVTAAGNVLVCLAIARERKLQNTTNYFLMSLAIADCLVAVLVMPMGMIAEVLGHFPLPHYACIIFATMDVLCCTSSIWHMSTMSMDRYFTIRFPFRYGRNKTRRIMLLKIIAVWAISTAISSPVFVLGIVDKENVLSNGICAPNNAAFKLYGSVFAFYIPFIIMVTTYALTMRSLRNVLVHKRKYNREKRRKQTFRPLAQLINQYAEIAQNIRQTSITNNQATTSVIIQNDNNNTNSISNKIPYNMVVTTTTTTTTPPTTTIASPIDSRTRFFPTNNSEINLIQDSNNIQYGSINMINGSNLNSEHLHHNNQHLTISYIKSSGSKKKRQQQQQQQQQALVINTPINRSKNECDMSTVYEITEYSKSTSSSHDVISLTKNSSKKKSITSIDLLSKQKQISLTKTIDNKKQQKNRNLTQTLTINAISPLQEDIISTTDTDSQTEKADVSDIDVIPPTATVPSSFSPQNDAVSLRMSWQYYLSFIEYIIQYYLFIYPYRLRQLSIQSSLLVDDNEKTFDEPSRFHQSTSTSFLNKISSRNSRSVSTQTSFLPSIDLVRITPSITPIPNNTPKRLNETCLDNPSKQQKSIFNRSILTSSSLFTNLFRQSSTGNLRFQHWSTKSSSSLGSSPRPNSRTQFYPKHSSGVLHQIESEMDHVLTDEHRPRAASSSSALLRSIPRQDNHWNRSLGCRQQLQSHSAYFLTHPNSYRSRKRQPLISLTNTNSSDSSSVFHRFNPRFLSTISNQYYQQQQSNAQRLRDEHIVAANERKALRVLLIIFCVFVTLWTPFFICTFISAICTECRERISSNIWFSITWLGYSSSMANPFIYTIFSDVFRRAFSNIIFCRSNGSLLSRQISMKFSHQKGSPVIQQQYSYKRSPHYEQSGTSTPSPYQPTTPHLHENNAIIYINRCASDSFR